MTAVFELGLAFGWTKEEVMQLTNDEINLLFAKLWQRRAEAAQSGGCPMMGLRGF